MSIEKRQFIRFSLDIQAFRRRKNGEVIQTVVRQVSVGGCLIDRDENVFVGDRFRLEFPLPNKNRLPLVCEAMYKSPDKRIGARFVDVSPFEQELLAQIIAQNLEDDGMPLNVDPFAVPIGR